MLMEHPHIERMHFREQVINGNLRQVLVVETNLKIPASGDFSENQELLALHLYLNHLANYDFADFRHVEICEYAPKMREGGGRAVKAA